MASKNVETLRAAHASWNKGDFTGVIRNATTGLAYADHGRNITPNTKDKFREWTEGWAKAFSDGRITNPQYIDAGNIVVAQFTVEGTNDGPFGSLNPTGCKMSLPFGEICHFDKQGRVVSGGCYYDQYTLLTQLGHIQPSTAPRRIRVPARQGRHLDIFRRDLTTCRPIRRGPALIPTRAKADC